MTTTGEWAEVPGFDGYLATRDGRVMGPSGKVLRQLAVQTGHLYVRYERGRHTPSRKLYVHRAVLLAFVGVPDDGLEARHLDGNPANNCLDNLAWGTRLENQHDRRLHGTDSRCERSGSHKLTARQVIEIRRRYAAGDGTLRSLGAEYRVSHTTILAAITHRHWKDVDNG